MGDTQASALRLSIIVPVFNEADGIAAAISDIRSHVMAPVPDSELIIVDDGSTDATASIVARLGEDDRRIRMLRQPNGGAGTALLHGVEASHGSVLLLLDGDRQIDLAGFGDCWERFAALDAYLGVRRPRHDPVYRRLASAMLRVVLWLQFGTRLHDAGAPFKLIRRAAWDDAKRHLPPHSIIPSILLATFLVGNPRWRVRQDPVPHRPRETGRSSFGLFPLMSFGMRALVDLRAFRRALKRDSTQRTA